MAINFIICEIYKLINICFRRKVLIHSGILLLLKGQVKNPVPQINDLILCQDFNHNDIIIHLSMADIYLCQDEIIIDTQAIGTVLVQTS
jgi:hypothetical protein